MKPIVSLVVEVPADDVEVASDLLWAHGVLAVEERAGAAGAVELHTSFGDERDALDPLVAAVSERWPHRFVEVDPAVVDTWRQFAEPVWIDEQLVIVPAWRPELMPAGSSARVIEIDPGATFGMGDHPTTLLTLRAMRRIPMVGRQVLDVGCGSGVLAIAALTDGAARAVGVDISPAAVPVSRANAERNGVADRLDVSTDPLADVRGAFDVVLANILAPALIELADDLQRVLVGGGTLVISGILADRHDHVLAALAPLRVVQVDELDGWAAISLRR